MARPKEFDRDTALDKAMKIFWKQGYEATSIQDLENHMGIGRRSIYDTFNSKYDLFVATLERYHMMRKAQTGVKVETLESPSQVIRAIFEDLIKESAADRNGCLYINSAVELAAHDGVVAGKSKKVYQGMETLFQNLLHKAQDLGEVSTDIDTLSVAQTLTVTFFGIRVMAKMNPDKGVLSNVVDNLLVFLP